MSARDYGKIHSSFWTSETIRGLSEDGRTLAAYLLTSPHTNMLGCFRLPVAYACDDLRWDVERFQDAFNNVAEHKFATIDAGTSWVVILKFLKWNAFENPNVGKAAAKIFMQIPDSCAAKSLLAECLRQYGKHFPEALLAPFDTVQVTVSKPFPNRLPNPSETVSEGFPKAFRNPEPEPEPNQNLKPLSGKPDDAPPQDGEKRDPELTLVAIDPVAEVIGYLNDRAGTKFQVVEASAKLIKARMREGATVALMRSVIDAKAREWPKGHSMRQYLRPATLFNAEKFAQYSGQLGSVDEQAPHGERSPRRLAF
jgi:uncharacterized phage protein (TIGR02220 family)